MNFKLISLSIAILIASFLELIIFNEEVLLALCFVSFVFFAYSYLNETVASIFSDRASKFEADIITAFEAKYVSITSYANELSLSKALWSALVMIEVFVIEYNTSALNDMKTTNTLAIITTINTKFNEILINERSSKSTSSIASIQSAVYPLIFNVLTKNIKLLTILPNSANRRVAKANILNSNPISIKIPGEGHSLQQHSSILIRTGRPRDLIAVKKVAIRGKYDLLGVLRRKTSRSIYGVKRL